MAKIVRISPTDPKTAMIDAAERAIASGGLEGLSVRKLVADAGVSIGMVSHVFGSLDGLILEVNARTLDALAAAFDKLFAKTSIEETYLLPAALLYFRYAQTQRPRWEALFRHRMRDQEPLPDWYAARRGDMLGRVARLMGADLASADGLLKARTAFEAVHGIVSLGLDRKLGGTEDEVVNRLTCLVDMIRR